MKKVEMENLAKGQVVVSSKRKDIEFMILAVKKDSVVLVDTNNFSFGDREVKKTTFKKGYQLVADKTISIKDLVDDVQQFDIVRDREFNILYAVAAKTDKVFTLIRIDDMEEMFDVTFNNFIECYVVEDRVLGAEEIKAKVKDHVEKLMVEDKAAVLPPAKKEEKSLKEEVEDEIKTEIKAMVEHNKAKKAARKEEQPAKKSRKKLDNPTYINIATAVITKQITQKAAAEKYHVDTATINDMLNPKYCRKSCRDTIVNIIDGQSEDMKLRSRWSLPLHI